MPKAKTKTVKAKPAKKVKKKVAATPVIAATVTNGNGANSRSQLSSLIKSARDIMRKDAGLNGDLDRLPQLSWILFLKCFDDLEQRREAEAEMAGNTYKMVIPKNFRWRDWAADADKELSKNNLVISHAEQIAV